MARGGQIENALVENQIGLALPGLQQFCLARASFKRDLQAPFDDPDRNHLLARIPRQDTVVERQSLRRRNVRFTLLPGLYASRDFADAPRYHLSRQAELFAGRTSTSAYAKRTARTSGVFHARMLTGVAAGASNVDCFLQRRQGFRRGRKL